jgi:hypothetical protein
MEAQRRIGICQTPCTLDLKVYNSIQLKLPKTLIMSRPHGRRGQMLSAADTTVLRHLGDSDSNSTNHLLAQMRRLRSTVGEALG